MGLTSSCNRRRHASGFCTRIDYSGWRETSKRRRVGEDRDLPCSRECVNGDPPDCLGFTGLWNFTSTEQLTCRPLTTPQDRRSLGVDIGEVYHRSKSEGDRMRCPCCFGIKWTLKTIDWGDVLVTQSKADGSVNTAISSPLSCYCSTCLLRGRHVAIQASGGLRTSG